MVRITNAPWGLDRLDQRVLPLSNSYTTLARGASVLAYIVDSGIMSAHDEFTEVRGKPLA